MALMLCAHMECLDGTCLGPLLTVKGHPMWTCDSRFWQQFGEMLWKALVRLIWLICKLNFSTKLFNSRSVIWLQGQACLLDFNTADILCSKWMTVRTWSLILRRRQYRYLEWLSSNIQYSVSTICEWSLLLSSKVHFLHVLQSFLTTLIYGPLSFSWKMSSSLEPRFGDWVKDHQATRVDTNGHSMAQRHSTISSGEFTLTRWWHEETSKWLPNKGGLAIPHS